MNKKIFIKLFLIALLIFPTTIFALEINSKYVVMYNLNDDAIIFEKNKDEKTEIASLTKIMTCIVAIENIDNLNETVVMKSADFKGLAEANASVAGFSIGDKVTYMDLLMGLFLPSGADAALALANNIGGNEKNFVKLMNEKAKELNLANTNFVNNTGLDTKGHYSTVSDVANLLKYALKNDTFKRIFETNEYLTTNNIKLYSTRVSNAKRYSLDISKITGSKTGYTGDAGLCLASTATYNNINYMLVTTGANPNYNIPYNFIDAKNIYEYYADNYDYHNIVNAGDILAEITTKPGYNTYQVYAKEDKAKYLNNDFNIENVVYKYNGIDALSSKNKINDKLGTIDIIYNNEVLDSIDVYLDKSLRFSLLLFLTQTKLIYPTILLLVIVLLSIIIILVRKKTNKK